MKRSAIYLTAALCLCGGSSAQAHHSHPYFYDQCRTTTIEGRVEGVKWMDPHTIVVLRLDNGTAYTIDWNPLSRLTNFGIVGPAKAALVTGARVSVTGNPIRTSAQIRERFPDYTYEVNPNTIDPALIRRADASWNWARTPADLMPNAAPPECTDPTKK